MNVTVAIFALLAFANYVGADKCEDNRNKCLEALYRAFQNSVGSMIDCKGLREAMNCFSVVCEKCLTGEKKKKTMERISRMIVDVRSICPKPRKKLEYAVEKDNYVLCFSESFIKMKVTSYLERCKTEVSSLRSIESMIFAHIFGFSTCQNFVATSRCITKKYGQDCGEIFEKAFFSGIMLGLKDDNLRIANSPECAEGIRKAEKYFRGVLNSM